MVYLLTFAGAAILLLYLSGLIAIYWLQGRLIYPGERTTRAHPLDFDPRFVWTSVVTADGLGLACRYRPPVPDSPLCILLLHGNGEDLRNRSAIAERLVDEGYGVLQVEYRGFAGNPGRPSEQGLYSDGRAALKLLESTGRAVVIHGYSLGSGVAVQLATETRCAGLILEAPFTSVVAVAKARLSWLPVERLTRDRYDSLSKIGRVRAPLLIYGGDEDLVIPPAHFEQLYAAANKPSKFFLIRGAGHVDVWESGGERYVLEFLRTVADQC